MLQVYRIMFAAHTVRNRLVRRIRRTCNCPCVLETFHQLPLSSCNLQSPFDLSSQYL